MQKPPRIIFFGSSKYVIPIIEVLKKNFELPLVITTEHSPNNPLVSYCKKYKLHYYIVLEFRKQYQEITKRIQNAKSRLGVLASFGAIVPNEVLNLFPHGIINVHPSLLPKYRGPTPVQTAILNGDKTTGVTIIKLDEQVDHGPILFQKKELIKENDTEESLYERLFKLSASSIVRTIELYLKGKIEPQEQNHKQASFTKRLIKQDGFIDIQSPPSPQILDRMIRAYHPWPSVWTKVQIATSNKQQLTINKMPELRSKELADSSQKLEVRVKFLPDKKIQVEGKKPMSYKDFLNGYGIQGQELLKKLNLY